MKIDLLAIGDTAIDEFIKLKDAHIHCNLDREGCELCLGFGKKIPYESATVIPATGNSTNVALATSRLGLKVAILTNLGDDQNGKNCLEKLKKENIDTTFVKIQKDKITNYHYVLWYDTERTILVKHEKYQYEWPKTKESEEYNPPAWIYLSSLGEYSIPFHQEIIEYLKKHTEVKLAFQPGTFQIKSGKDILKEIYARTEAFFSNVEEAQKILNVEDRDILKLCQDIEALGPKMVFLSDGEKGAYFYQKKELYFIPAYPDPNPVFERTGAGDAFSGTIVAGLNFGLSPIEAFSWGPINARSVVKYIGPQEGLLTREKLETYLKNAPVSYQVKKIS